MKIRGPLAGVGVDGAGVHLYHQHINNFQIVGIQRGPTSTYPDISPDFVRIGEWRDTVMQPDAPDTYLVLRTKPMTYTGVGVMHCHILDHEDMGMMALYNIQQC